MVGQIAPPDPTTAVEEEVGQGIWAISCANYNTMLVDCGDSFLAADPLPTPRAGAYLDAVGRIIGNRTISTIFLSHAHWDHIGGTSALLASNFTAGDTKVVAGSLTANKTRLRFGLEVEPVSERLEIGSRAMQLAGAYGHAADNTSLRVDDVILCVDTIHPGQFEVRGFGLAEDIWAYKQTLKVLQDEDWRVMIPGHARLGTHDDVAIVAEYLGEIASAVRASAPGHLSTSLDADVAAVIQDVVPMLRPRWGEWPKFEDWAPSHIEKVYWDQRFFAPPGTEIEDSTS